MKEMKVSNPIKWLILTVAFLTVTIACGNADADKPASRPLPRAWPRPPVTVSDSMDLVPGLPVGVSVNPAAQYEIKETDPPSLTVRYPGLEADIYYTFVIPVNEDMRKKIIEARQERISLNLNGLPAQTLHGQSSIPSAEAIVVVAQSGTQTPVQLLADLPQCVITATAFLHNPRVTQMYDSIKPVIDILRHDIMKSVSMFEYK